MHDLRHFVATRLLAADVEVRTVSGRLGHSLTSTTLNVDAAFLPDAVREAAEVIGRLATNNQAAFVARVTRRVRDGVLTVSP